MKISILTCLTFVLIFHINQIVNANEVIGCGGFIKSNTEINFKIIKVKLLSKDGAVKYTTEASPVNGYYMIPIYNKGEFVLQVNPPPGWSFEPNQVNINVDGENDPCSKNEDINFFFKGFGLSGRVVTQGDSRLRGPAGVKLTLLLNNKPIDTTQSGTDGSYYFSNVMPGTYQVEASHPNFKFLANKVNVELSKENWSAKDNIVIAGFNIEGRVTTQDNSPIQDALVELHFFDDSYSKIDTKNFECDLKSKNNLKICVTRTDSNGKFVFSNIAFGKYKLFSTLSKDLFEFNMKPDYLNVDLTKHENLVLTEAFILNSVFINSRVLLSVQGRALETGDVYLNGQKYKTLNKDGSFRLGKLTSGTYKLNIKSNNVYYEEKSVNLDLSSSSILQKDSVQYKNLLSLTNFVAKSFDVCGQVKINLEKNSNLLKDLPNSVQIKCYLAPQNENDKPKFYKSSNLNQDLKYCLVLDSNVNYLIRAELSESLSKVLRLAPFERKITLTESSLFDVNFEQLEAKLEGKIKLLAQEIPKDLVVNLKSIDSQWSQDISVNCAKEQENIECLFSLTNLLFGNYYLTTNYDDLYCWKKQNDQQKLVINVNSELQKVLIEQTGVKLKYKLSHKNAMLKIVDLNKNILLTRNFLNEADLNGELCLPKIDDYLALVDSCHRFTSANSDQDTIQINSGLFKKNSNFLVLKANKHQTTVDILFKFDDLNDKKLINNEDLVVEVKTTDSKQIDLIQFKVKSETQNHILFTGKTWLEPNQDVVLVAKSNKVLFESNNKNLRINENNCESNYAKFEAILGIFIVGTIRPSDIDSIDLTLRLSSDNSTILQTTVNGATGFKLGPLRAPNSQYSVELSKSGYLFSKLNSESKDKDVYNLEFQAQKLGQLKVNVVDSKLKTNLENVLLSLSSENRLFRQTFKTDQTGQVSFDNLKPGLYYLIVMMQEYEFKPNSHPIQITDGFHMNLVVEADRVAFSCFGKVTSINGQAENNVLVEAVGLRSQLDLDTENENCRTSRENSEVEAGLGTYRIRNLRPNCEYELKVRSLREQDTEKRNFKIVPEYFILKINHSDALDKNFVLIENFNKVDLSLSVSYQTDDMVKLNPRQQLNYFVRVKLFRTNQPDLVIQTQYSPVNSVLYFNKLNRDQNQQYSVQVELLAPIHLSVFGTLNHHQQSLLQQQPVIEKTELSFYADNAFKHLSSKFEFNKKTANSDAYDLRQQQYQNFYFTLPLFILIIGLALNSTKTQQNLTNIRNSIQQRGGLVNFVRSIFKKPAQVAPQDITVTKSGKLSKTSKKSKELNSSDNENQKNHKQKTVIQAVQALNDQGSTDQSEGENFGATEEGDLLVLHPIKRKVKKTY